MSFSCLRPRLCLSKRAVLYSCIAYRANATRMGAVERAVLEAYHPCKEQRGLLWELHRFILFSS